MGDGGARGGSKKKVLLASLVFVGIVGLGGAAVAFRAYDKATEINRSYPEVVVGEYVDTYLVRRDDARTPLFTCSSGGNLGPMRDLRADLEREERELSLSTRVTLGATTKELDGKSVLAELEIVQKSGRLATVKNQMWKFTMVQDDGWRVCGAERLPDPPPTPSPSATQPTAP